MKTIVSFAAALMLSCLMAAQPAVAAPEAKVTPLRTEPLPEYPGKEAEMIIVEYPPGSADPVHRHDAHAFVYVLEGSIVMALKGGKEVTPISGTLSSERTIPAAARVAGNEFP
ncbi:cupin domain-containing protein, partial [Cupriavidus sp. AcVe19-1a]|uniref:cupin domain-containing protein n=1 Tax=Cupriavidus sp. AcVe19-1a TaxID=2821359 RepID=UPI001FD7BD58